MIGCLLVIDMQKGIFTLKQAVYQKEILIAKTKAALNFARDSGMTVIFSRHENSTFLKKGTQGYPIIDELEIRTGEPVMEKRHPDIFMDTGLYDLLREKDISSVMIAGLISNGCVRASCLSALNRHYEVILIEDAHSTFYSDGEKIIRDVNVQMEKAGAHICPAEELARMHGFSSPAR